MTRALAPLLLAVALAGCGAGTSCPYRTRCEGNVLQLCQSASVRDPPVYSTQDCGAPAGLCVVDRRTGARCVTTCDATYLTHCEGDFLVGCDFSSGTGLVTAVDCGTYFLDLCDPFYGCDVGGSCVDQGGGYAECQPF